MLYCVLAVLFGVQGQHPAAHSKVKQLIARSGAEVAIAYRALDGRDELLIDADKSFHAASTMKVPVMIELFRQAHQGTLSLDEPLLVRNQFHSIVDGSPYALDIGDDSDEDVYEAVGRTLTLRRLCELMITVSSNFAANLLIERLGVDRIRWTVSALGAEGMQVLRGVEDDKAFQKGLNNTTTARGLLVLLERVAQGRAVSPEADRLMVEMLARQRFNDGIPAGLPSTIRVAHKTGSITRIQHDAGIVFGKRPYVLVVLIRGIEDEKKSKALIAEISRALYGRQN
jgi:beta-lactamase class A